MSDVNSRVTIPNDPRVSDDWASEFLPPGISNKMGHRLDRKDRYNAASPVGGREVVKDLCTGMSSRIIREAHGDENDMYLGFVKTL
jgi:hypothetical protein